MECVKDIIINVYSIADNSIVNHYDKMEINRIYAKHFNDKLYNIITTVKRKVNMNNE